jgi:hypothetical protein
MDADVICSSIERDQYRPGTCEECGAPRRVARWEWEAPPLGTGRSDNFRLVLATCDHQMQATAASVVPSS